MENSKARALEPAHRLNFHRWWPLIRGGTAVMLLAALLYYADVREVLLSFTNLRLIHIVCLLLLTVVLIWLSCLKWRLFIRAAGFDARLTQLMKYYTMAYFFNMFFPSSLGGDIARSVQLGQELDNLSSAFAATFMERVTGVLAMTFLGVLFVALNAPATTGVEITILVVGFFSFCGALVCFSEKLGKVCFTIAVAVSRTVGLKKAAQKLDSLGAKIMDSTAFARNNAPLFGKAMLYSFAFHFFAVVNTYVAALAIGWSEASFGSLFIVVPLVLLVGAVPVTPSSVGVQEGAFLFFLRRVGATSPQGFAVALVLRAKNIITAIAGGLIWLAMRSQRGKPQY